MYMNSWSQTNSESSSSTSAEHSSPSPSKRLPRQRQQPQRRLHRSRAGCSRRRAPPSRPPSPCSRRPSSGEGGLNRRWPWLPRYETFYFIKTFISIIFVQNLCTILLKEPIISNHVSKITQCIPFFRRCLCSLSCWNGTLSLGYLYLFRGLF